MPGLLEEIRLGDVWRVDELVTRLLVALATVVLHDLSNHSALRVEHGETRANLFREREQIQFGAQTSVVALGGLFEALKVLTKLVLGGPCGAINTLKLLVLFRTSPVGGGRTHQFEGVADHSSVWKVRSSAKVEPDGFASGRVNVVVNRQLAGANLGSTIAELSSL